MLQSPIDPSFRVEIDQYSSSLSPQQGIWRGQHQCVSEGFGYDDLLPDPERSGNAVIKHELANDRGHYSVLDFGYVVFHCEGFPHSTMSQITRHTDSSFLVQSGRYTGNRFLDVAACLRNIEDVFFFRALGKYTDREGKKYEYTQEDRELDKLLAFKACVLYAERIKKGWSYEHARENLPYNFRQNFCVASTIKNFFHWADQRSKKDSELEIQQLTRLCMNKFTDYCPQFAAWYESERYGKARLAP